MCIVFWETRIFQLTMKWEKNREMEEQPIDEETLKVSSSKQTLFASFFSKAGKSMVFYGTIGNLNSEWIFDDIKTHYF